MIKAIIFDLGGVIIKDNYKKYVVPLIHAMPEKFRKTYEKVEFLAATGKMSKKEIIEAFNHDFKVGFYQKIEEKIYEANIKRQNKKVLGLIHKLKVNYKIGLLSNNLPWWSRIAKKQEFIKLFDPAIFSDDVGMVKPSSQVYKYLIRTLNLKPEEILFIDDQEQNIIGAKDLGIKTIWYQSWKMDLEKELIKFNVKI